LKFEYVLLVAVASAVGVGLVITALVYSGSRQISKRYRPGRPFEFRPVWFLAAPDRQLKSAGTSRELVVARRLPAARSARAKETGGASDRW
jgi:hypothetical protein